jgi:hypothetical protein
LKMACEKAGVELKIAQVKKVLILNQTILKNKL